MIGRNGERGSGISALVARDDDDDDDIMFLWSPEDEEAVMDALIAHMVFDPATNTYKPGNHSSREEVEATLIPFSPCPDPRRAKDIPSSRPTKLRIYPDSGATICLGGTKHLRHMGMDRPVCAHWNLPMCHK